MPLQSPLFTLAGWVIRHQQQAIEYLTAENAALQEQRAAMRRRFNNARSRHLAPPAQTLGRGRPRELSPIVIPDTLVRRYRTLAAAYYGPAKNSPGRPRVGDPFRKRVAMIAIESPGWSKMRIQGAQSDLGYLEGRKIIRRFAIERRVDSAGRTSMSWRTLPIAYCGAIEATNSVTVEVVTSHGLI